MMIVMTLLPYLRLWKKLKASGKSVYIPEGRFNFDKQVNIEADNLKISGAGVWHTQLPLQVTNTMVVVLSSVIIVMALS